MNTIQLRQSFLNYFRKEKHRFMPPSKVYNDDPTLLFVNAGMNQLKDVFLGKKEPGSSTKLMNYQICIRAGGKHNDLDDVGKDSYHLTSFEMLGNWSINDYWKDDAIQMAFTFLIDVCGLDRNRMYATYFEGTDDVSADDESREIWKKFLPEDQIVPGNFKDNFWMMGDSGPCGKCTEIHYDLVGNRSASQLVNKDDPTVIEIWNLVFVEYNKDESGYHLLDKRFVDTGMGLERLSMVLQNKTSIFQTDAMRYIIGYAQAITNGEIFGDSYSSPIDTAYRIFADHMRTVVIALYQGVIFDCNGKSGVLRKIFRRLLNNVYLHLNNKQIKAVIDHPAIKALISDILNYYLIKKHDAESIHKQLIAEEQMYLTKYVSVQNVYNKVKKQLKEPDLIFAKLKESYGLDADLVVLLK